MRKTTQLYLVLIALTALLLVSCHTSSRNEQPRPYYNYSYVPDTSRFGVPYAYYNANGYTRFYYPNSSIISVEGNYQNGTPTGYWKQYYASGKMMKEGNYSNGQLSGYWKFYYESGQLKEEGNYDNNIKSGTWKYFFENGQISSEGNYSNGNKSSEWKYFNPDGTLLNAVMY